MPVAAIDGCARNDGFDDGDGLEGFIPFEADEVGVFAGSEPAATAGDARRTCRVDGRHGDGLRQGNASEADGVADGVVHAERGAGQAIAAT